MKTNVTTLQANSGKVLDTSTNQMVQVYGDVVGYVVHDYPINFTTSASSQSINIFYYSDYFYRIETQYEGSSITFRLYRGAANLNAASTINALFKTNSALYSGSSTPIQGVTTVCAINNALAHFNFSDNMPITIVYDLEKARFWQLEGPSNVNSNLYGTVSYTYEYGLTTDYLYYLQRRNSYFSIYYRSRNGGDISSIGINCNVNHSYICGIFGNDIYAVIANSTDSSAVGYVIHLYSGTYENIGWFNPSSSSKLSLIPLFFDNRYIYGLTKNMSNNNCGNTIFVYDMAVGTSNLSTISVSSNALLGDVIGNASIHYIGNIQNTIAYILLLPNGSSNTPIAMRIDTSSKTYSCKELNFMGNVGSTYLNCLPKTGSFKRIINDSFLAGSESIPYNGVLLNWDRGTLTYILGLNRNDNLKVYYNSYTNFDIDYPKLRYGMYSTGNLMRWDGIIRNYGTILSKPYFSLPTTSVIPGKIIGKSIAKFYTSF